jgi:acetyl-CoA C-acetyltransferase
MDAQRTPVVVSAGQVTEREELVTAVELAARAAERAFEASPGLCGRIERVTMVSVVFSPVSSRPGSELAARLGLGGAVVESSATGGNLPQWLVNRAAREIRDGRLGTTLIAGGEATRSMRAADPEADFMRARKPGAATESPDPVVGPSMKGVLGAAEIGIRLFQPTDLYALFEAARAHANGRSFDEQRAFLGPLMARFSEVAAKHPNAWFRDALTPDEVAKVSEDNRLIAEPYPKRMNAFPHVDQGAAVVVTSLATARELGLEDCCMFVWSGAEMMETAPATRRDPSDAPAMRRAASAALEAAGVGADDLDWIDLYSCFPVAVQVGADGLGVALDDPRGLTITGGLPFFGGPGNDYSLHAIATLADRLRESGGLGYIGANGGMLSKHSMGVYGAKPPPAGFVTADTRDAQAEIDAAALPTATEADGPATVVAATVVYDRDGSVRGAPALATLEDGRRVAAEADASIRASLAGTNLVGRSIRVSGSPSRYVVEA